MFFQLLKAELSNENAQRILKLAGKEAKEQLGGFHKIFSHAIIGRRYVDEKHCGQRMVQVKIFYCNENEAKKCTEHSEEIRRDTTDYAVCACPNCSYYKTIYWGGVYWGGV